MIPVDGVVDKVLEHVPTEVKMTITTSPTRGVDPTIALAERLSGHGYAVVPHLSARLVRDRGHLAELVERLREAGIRDVFVVAGDATKCKGDFDGAAALLRELATLDHPFRQIGVTGYPESHAFISDDTTIQAMYEKAEFATYIVSQICFDPSVTADWVEKVWRRGTRLPIYVGLPGPISRGRLLRIAAKIGLGDSTRFLRTHGSWISRFFGSGFSPDPILAGLSGALADPQRKVAGFHIFTFNDLAETERWRQEALARGRQS